MCKDKLRDKQGKFIALIVSEIVVFGSAYFIVGRFFPAEQVIYDAILIVLIFAVGITIMLRGNATRNRGLSVAGFIVFLFAVFVVIYIYEGFAVKISAFATLAVAIAAFASYEENMRMRLERREEEKKAEKERMLNEIESWAKRLFGSAVVLARPVGGRSEIEGSILECRSGLLLSMAERIRVQTICNNLSLKAGISASDEVKIKKSMSLVSESLDGLFGELGEVLAKEMKANKKVEALKERAGSLSSNVGKLLKVVSEIAVA